MNKKYSEFKKEIYGYYSHIGDIDVDSIEDANDHIVDEHLGKDVFENSLYEFYVTVAMCNYMVEHNLYDQYFFESYNELLDEYNSMNTLVNNIEEELKNDIDSINEYVKKDEMKSEYYNNLSNIYNDAIKEKEEK